MSWYSSALNSTLGKKLIMATSGLFLILFLIGHVSGNFQLFLSDGGEAFNKYAYFMTHNPAIKVLSYVTYISIIAHVIYSILLTIHNRKARPVGYAVTNAQANSKWNSRNMGLLGSLILLFIVIHMKSFWYEMHWGGIPTVIYPGDSMEYKDLYTLVFAAFSQWWYVVFYLFSLLVLGYHLNHGFHSAFQSLGINHKKYTPLIKGLGFIYSLAIPLMFASQPVFVFLKSNNLI